MESNRTGTDQVPEISRRKVLRPGVRIIANQFADFDPIEDETESTLEAIHRLQQQIAQATIYMPRASVPRMAGKSAHLRNIDEATKAFDEALKKLDAEMLKKQEADAAAMAEIQNGIAKAMQQASGVPMASRQDLTITWKNDGVTEKKPRQSEPEYVRLTRVQRR